MVLLSFSFSNAWKWKVKGKSVCCVWLSAVPWPAAFQAPLSIGFSWLEKTPWRRKWQPTPVFWPGKSHGERRLVGYSPWGHERFKYDLETKQQQMKWREKIFFISQCRAKIFFVFAQYWKFSQQVFINQILTKEVFWVKITNVLPLTYCFRT